MSPYEQLLTELRSIALLESCSHVLSWDEQTYMPPGGAEHRANQLSLLAGMAHQRWTSPELGDMLAAAEQTESAAEADSAVAVNLRETRRRYDRATKIPQELVEELSRIRTLSQQAWVEARKEADFSKFLPWLKQVIALRREEAEAVGYGDGVPYDALLDEYEPGMSSVRVTELFAGLRDELIPLIQKIVDCGRHPDISIFKRHYPIPAQRSFGTQVASAIGFDFHKGRLDEAAHPFCSEFGPGDTRLTTRYKENYFPSAFFGTIHEAGHGIYDQGLPMDQFGTPMGTYVSLGIHESQSQLWENIVGRSAGFWRHFFPIAQQSFPEALADVSEEDFVWCVNDVRPSFIRVEADEVTYNLHILLRYELEQLFVYGDLPPEEIPAAWNEKFQQYFGIMPKNDALGCLQDIHWSEGMVGYFPTYALGNMYAAQFYEAAERDLGDLDQQFAAGDFKPLKSWLNEKIHSRGQQYRATRLVEVVTGEQLAYQPLVKQLREKYTAMYQL